MWAEMCSYLSKLVCTVCAASVVVWCSYTAEAGDYWREVVGKDRTHVVQSGESIYSIAQKYGLAIEHIAFANGRDPNNINVAPGTSLIIPGRRILPKNPPSNGLVVNLPERGVYLFRNGAFEKFYPVAIGQSGRFQTPQGNFVIEARTKDPAWFPPEWANMGEEVVPAGPSNPLGDRWIGLSAPGIGLHSTNSPMSIGQAASHGCMRMYPDSVHELFDKVQVGWPVRIEYEVAKAGCDYNNDRYYVVAYPDVYGQSGPRQSTSNALDKVGLVVDPSDLDYFAKADGLCKELYVGGVTVSVGRERQSEWPIEPSMVDGTIWGSPKIAKAAGLDVVWDNVKQVVQVSRGKQILYFPVDDSYVIDPSGIKVGYSATVAGTARKIGSDTVIPLRPVLKAFNIPSQWDGAARELRISKLSSRPAKTEVSAAATTSSKQGILEQPGTQIDNPVEVQPGETSTAQSSEPKEEELDGASGESIVDGDLEGGTPAQEDVSGVNRRGATESLLIPQRAPLPDPEVDKYTGSDGSKVEKQDMLPQGQDERSIEQ